MQELDEGWQIIEGDKAVLVVAGHNFRQIREDEVKPADLGTGDIARKLCEKYDLNGIVSTKVQEDPNWYRHSPFRDKIRKIVKDKKIELIIDIHGKRLDSDNLIQITPNKIFREKYDLVRFGLPLSNFVENEQETVGEEFDDCVATVQVEIREDGRVTTIDELKFKETAKMLENVIEALI